MGTSRGASNGKWVAVVAALVIAAAGASGYFYWNHTRSQDTYTTTDESRAAVPEEISAELPGAQPADIPVATLVDYYEHIVEHMPPRDPNSAMQRREKFYRNPRDPLTLIETKLTSSEADSKLRARFQEWRDNWQKGPQRRLPQPYRPYQARYTEPAPGSLEDVAAKSSLSAVDLLEISRATAFLDSDDTAAMWIGAGLNKAEQEYKSMQPGDPRAVPLLRELDQTKSVYRLMRYGLLEKRTSLAMALYAPLSIEQRRSAELHAMSLYYQQRPAEAADAIIAVWEQHRQAGDLGVMEKSDLPEMNWLSAIYCQSAQRYADAAKYYQEFLKYEDGRKQSAERMLVMCLMMAGDTQKAEQIRHQYGLPVIPLPQTRPMTRPTRVVSTTQPGPTGRYAATRPATRTATTRMAYPNTRPVFRQPVFGYGGPRKTDDITTKLSSDDPEKIQNGVDAIRSAMQANPTATIDRLNDDYMIGLTALRRFAEIDEFATAGTIAAPADTARVEQLQKHRITALTMLGKNQEAMQAARGLFNVSGMGFSKEAIQLLISATYNANRSEPAKLSTLRLQMLATAQEDPAERKKLLAKYGGNSVMESIPADPAPYADAIAKRSNLTDYHGMYGTGNLLLLSGRIKEAHDIFLRIYKIAPPAELKYATEGIAKLMKAEEGGIGKADDFVETIRPKE